MEDSRALDPNRQRFQSLPAVAPISTADSRLRHDAGMTDWSTIASLATRWSDGGLWDDVMALASRAWSAPPEKRRVEWHHLVLAVGNFKRQAGRRLYPAPLAMSAGTVRAESFEYPLTSGRTSVQCGNEASWLKLERNLRGAAAATTTTLLAALWPDEHFIFDWRVLSALVGLQSVDADIDEPTFAVPATGLAASMAYYPWARAIVLRASTDATCSARDVERGLYKLSQKVPSEAGRSWDAYGRELQAAATHAESAADGDDGVEEA